MKLPARRTFVGQAMGAMTAAFFATRGLFAEHLAATPRLTEGPYYPDHLPLDRDNDLVIIGDNLTPATGEITHLSGRILGPGGDPVRDALIEIWQVDNRGVYICSRAPNAASHDPNFQGYGRYTTGSTGEYRFRTIKPVPYDNRTPHIHVKISRGGSHILTTQIFIEGNPLNASDGVLRELRDPLDRELVTARFAPLPSSRTGELAAKFDIVIGRTPGESR